MKNWAGNYAYGVDTIDTAGSVEQVQECVCRHRRLKVLGTRHCFNGIADSRHRFISLERLDTIGPPDALRQTVTIGAGVRYGELAERLHVQGWALHNMASLPHISVAGGCATATHGSGLRNTCLPAAVRGMRFVAASGELVSGSAEADPEWFPGAVVHLGGLGVVTELTLAIEPAYNIRQRVYENLPLAQLERHYEAIMTAGYSVSLFTNWRDKNIGEVWVKSRPGGEGEWQDPESFFGARAATRPLHPIKGLLAENCTEQLGLAGPWHERLPHFRMGFTPSSGDELQTEYFVPFDRSYDALCAVERLHETIGPLLQVSEIRCIAADDLWMSPCFGQPCTAIHFTWKPAWPAVRAALPLLEAALAPYNARPHWGKLFTMPHERLSALYEKLPAFRQLLERHDPEGRFRNDWLDALIFGRGTYI